MIQLNLKQKVFLRHFVAVGFTKQLVVLTFQGLGHALAGLGSIIAGGLTGNHAAREKGQAQAERGRRFLKAPPFLASSRTWLRCSR